MQQAQPSADAPQWPRPDRHSSHRKPVGLGAYIHRMRRQPPRAAQLHSAATPRLEVSDCPNSAAVSTRSVPHFAAKAAMSYRQGVDPATLGKPSRRLSQRRQLGTPAASPDRYFSSRSAPARRTGAAYRCHSICLSMSWRRTRAKHSSHARVSPRGSGSSLIVLTLLIHGVATPRDSDTTVKVTREGWRSPGSGIRGRRREARATQGDTRLLRSHLVGLGSIASPTESLQVLLHREAALGDGHDVIHFEQQMRFCAQGH